VSILCPREVGDDVEAPEAAAKVRAVLPVEAIQFGRVAAQAWV